jgi:uncharacterized membrane protein YdjX (TVP38/TMEM64 family)
VRPKLVSRTTLLNAVSAVIAIALLFVSVSFVGAETMKKWVEAAGVWGPAVFVIAKITTIVVAPLSGGLLYPIAGTLFGFWKGLGLVVLGDAIGGVLAFWISRAFGRAVVERMLGKENGGLARVLETIGTVRGFLVTRVIFIMSQDLMSYAAGLTRLPFLAFVTIHVGVGILPNALMTSFGAFVTESNTGARLGGIISAIGLAGGLSALALMWYGGKRVEVKSK